MLKKSAMLFTAEKYASELEIFVLNRGLQAQISRRYAKKRHFQRLVHAQPGRTDFFNTIGQKLPFESFFQETSVRLGAAVRL